MSNADAARRYRLRKAGQLEALPCCAACGKQVRSAHDGLCSRCWYKTPAGKLDVLARTRKTRERQRQREQA